ncbi:MAG: hypothetical protein WCR01_07000 [Bacteroidota bacterium]
MKKFLIPVFLLIALFSSAKLFGVTKPDFNTVDELTYRYFLAQKWDSVILVGKEALRENIDFYFLRVRMGLAYYEQKEYIPAANHLVKARQFDPKDPVIADYLYYTYIFTNRLEEARMLQASLPIADRNITDKKKGVVDFVNFESGYTFSSNNTLKDKPNLMESDSIYGETDLYGNYLYEHLGLKFNLSNRIGLSVAYTYLNFSKLKYIQDVTYNNPPVTHDTSFQYNVNQHEFHAGLSWYLNGGFRIMPAFHMIYDNYPYTSASFDTVLYKYQYSRTDTSFTNYLVGLSLSKEIGRFNIGISGSYSNFNNRKQKQAVAYLTWLPFGNLNLYSTTTVTGFFQSKDNRLLLSQVIGARITPWCWGEGSFYYGDYTNANILNGSVVYNNSDVIDYRVSANLYFLVGKHLQFSLIYQYAQKESKQYFFTVNSSTKEISSTPKVILNPYNTHTIIGGITWKL